MNGSHPPRSRVLLRRFVGHYEGDTLVIDTIAIKPGPFAMIDWFGTPQTVPCMLSSGIGWSIMIRPKRVFSAPSRTTPSPRWAVIRRS